MTPSRFLHYKGGVYEVFCISKQEATWDDLVTYFDVNAPLNADGTRRLATRPATEWYGEVTVEVEDSGVTSVRRARRYTPLDGQLDTGRFSWNGAMAGTPRGVEHLNRAIAKWLADHARGDV